MTAPMAIPPGIPILGAKAPIKGDLSFVAVETSVNDKLMPVVSVLAEGVYEGRPVTLIGQLSLPELHAMAISWFQTAISGNHDAAVAQQLVVGAGATPAQAVAFVEALEARRHPAPKEKTAEGS